MDIDTADFEKFTQELNILAETYSKKLSQPLIKHYFLSLSRYHIDTVCHVVRNWSLNTSHRKFPLVGDLLAVVKANSSREYAVKATYNEHVDKEIKRLEDEFTLVCKQICANQDNSNFRFHPMMRKIMERNSKAAGEICRDYGEYETTFSNKELYEKQRDITKQISDLLHREVK